ncbi:hypothetical protein B0O80DRAFT_534461 [Mortierella sp. GBAus27b]|nr:hypothetical protein B0O80DRAFT_534461 [Mortierella sp. GBAus27b]
MNIKRECHQEWILDKIFQTWDELECLIVVLNPPQRLVCYHVLLNRPSAISATSREQSSLKGPIRQSLPTMSLKGLFKALRCGMTTIPRPSRCLQNTMKRLGLTSSVASRMTLGIYRLLFPKSRSPGSRHHLNDLDQLKWEAEHVTMVYGTYITRSGRSRSGKCHVYTMQLEHEALSIPMFWGMFMVPTSHDDIGSLLASLPKLPGVRSIAERMINQIRKR